MVSHFHLYSRDSGWPRRPWPNAGRKKQKNGRKSVFFCKKIKITNFFLHVWQNIGGNKFLRTVVSPKWVKSKRLREKEEEVGNNNGQLCIATPPRVAHAKPPGPKHQNYVFILFYCFGLSFSLLFFFVLLILKLYWKACTCCPTCTCTCTCVSVLQPQWSSWKVEL